MDRASPSKIVSFLRDRAESELQHIDVDQSIVAQMETVDAPCSGLELDV